MGTPLGPKKMPYDYMDPVGKGWVEGHGLLGSGFRIQGLPLRLC